MPKNNYINREFGDPVFAGRYWVTRRPFRAAQVRRSSLPRPELRQQVRFSGGYTQRPLLPKEKKNV